MEPNQFEEQEQDEQDEDDFIACLMCEGEACRMGELGWMRYYRCRQCGYIFGKPGPDKPNFE